MDDYMCQATNRMVRGAAALLISMTACLAGNSAHAEAMEHVVTIEAMRYKPEVIEAEVGDTIVWQNKDAFPHTVTAADRSFDSGSIASESSWKYKVRRKGTVPYICTLHPTMKATLIVK